MVFDMWAAGVVMCLSVAGAPDESPRASVGFQGARGVRAVHVFDGTTDRSAFGLRLTVNAARLGPLGFGPVLEFGQTSISGGVLGGQINPAALRVSAGARLSWRFSTPVSVEVEPFVVVMSSLMTQDEYVYAHFDREVGINFVWLLPGASPQVGFSVGKSQYLGEAFFAENWWMGALSVGLKF